MTKLQTVLREVAARIQGYAGKPRVNEQNTKGTLIEPVLRALGWDLEDLDEVQREYKPMRRDNPVDYAFFELRSPRLFLEAKALGENLNDRKWAGQIFSYAAVAGVEWVVLTNGREYRIYNAHAPVGVEEKLFRGLDVVSEPRLAVDTLHLISKTSMQGNRLEALWRAQFVDRQVRTALETAISADPDPSIVRVLTKRIPALGSADIRASLTRMRMTLEFPLDPVLEVADGASAQADASAESPRAGGAGVSEGGGDSDDVRVRDLIEAGLLVAGAELAKTYKGVSLTATVLENGDIRFAGGVYHSPSSAGAEARASVQGLAAGAKRPSTNGWAFWRYRTSGGATPTLDDLRRRLGDDDGPALRILKGGG